MTDAVEEVLDFEAVLGKAVPREARVSLCLAGHLQGEWEALERQLADAASLVGESLAGSPRVPIAQRMEELRAEMAEATVEFRFRALSPKAWSDLLAKHPAERPEQLFDPETLGPAAIAACAVSPPMTFRQYSKLAEKLTFGQQEALMGAVWDLNTEAVRTVPFSLLASATVASHTAGS